MEAIAPEADLTLIIGSPNSSNSVRLVEVARAAGCPAAFLVQNAAAMDWRLLDGVTTVAISAGASAPEGLVEELIEACRERFAVTVREIGSSKRTSPSERRRSRCGMRRERR